MHKPTTLTIEIDSSALDDACNWVPSEPASLRSRIWSGRTIGHTRPDAPTHSPWHRPKQPKLTLATTLGLG